MWTHTQANNKISYILKLNLVHTYDRPRVVVDFYLRARTKIKRYIRPNSWPIFAFFNRLVIK